MRKEYEIVSKKQTRAFHLLLVQMERRTEHFHSELELGLILEGTVTLRCGGRSRALQSGEMYVLNPGERHSFDAGRKGTLILAVQMSRSMITSFSLSDRDTYFMENEIRSFFTGHETRYDIMKGLLIELGVHYFSKLANYEYKCMSLLNMIMFILNSFVPKRTLDARAEEKLQSESRLQHILSYIDENFQHKLLLRDIAEREGLSLSYLSHFFTDSFGMSFQEYLNKKRLEHAVGLLLNTDSNLLAISVESGFSDIRYLNQMCSKEYGCSAAEVRKRRPQTKGTQAEITETRQRLYSAGDSLLRLNPLREAYRSKYSSYTIWDFYR